MLYTHVNVLAPLYLTTLTIALIYTVINLYYVTNLYYDAINLYYNVPMLHTARLILLSHTTHARMYSLSLGWIYVLLLLLLFRPVACTY